MLVNFSKALNSSAPFSVLTGWKFKLNSCADFFKTCVILKAFGFALERHVPLSEIYQKRRGNHTVEMT